MNGSSIAARVETIYLGDNDFSGNRTDWPPFEENVISAAISYELSHKGLLTTQVMEEDEWNKYLTLDEAAELLDEDQNYVLSDEAPERKEQETLRLVFRMALLKKLTTGVQEFLKSLTRTGRLSELSLKDIMDNLRKEYAKVSYTEIRALLATLAIPFSPLNCTHFDYINSHMVVHSKLRRIQGGIHQYADILQIEALRKGLEPCGLFAAEMESVDRHYPIDIPLFKDWKKLLIDAITRSDAARTTRSAGYANAARPSAHWPDPSHEAPADYSANSSTGIRPNSGSPKTFRCYCWTHGLNNSHHSHECKAKETGHQDAATANNRLNGFNGTVLEKKKLKQLSKKM